VANAYNSGNFNIDTSANIAALITLKGSSIVNTDKIYVYNGATLTCEQNFTITTINLGVMSSGAAGVGNRYGICTVNAGVTITFLGGATNTANGIISNPTSADSSSLNCALNIQGTTANRVVFTNSVGSSSNTKAYCIYMIYGTITGTNIDINYSYGNPIFCSVSTVYQNAPHYINDCNSTAQTLGTSIATVVCLTNTNINTSARFTNLNLPVPVSCGNPTLIALAGASCYIVSGGSIISSGTIGSPSISSTYYITPIAIYRGVITTYYNTQKISYLDVRPTGIVPATLAFTNPGLGGQLRFTISNAASYNQNGNLDSIYIYNSSGNALLCTFPIALYNSLGYGIVPGLTDGTAYTLYAKASTDGYQFSAASANATAATPTHLSYFHPTAVAESFAKATL
jgi:hypothetical protein